MKHTRKRPLRAEGQKRILCRTRDVPRDFHMNPVPRFHRCIRQFHKHVMPQNRLQRISLRTMTVNHGTGGNHLERNGSAVDLDQIILRFRRLRRIECRTEHQPQAGFAQILDSTEPEHLHILLTELRFPGFLRINDRSSGSAICNAFRSNGIPASFLHRLRQSQLQNSFHEIAGIGSLQFKLLPDNRDTPRPD